MHDPRHISEIIAEVMQDLTPAVTPVTFSPCDAPPSAASDSADAPSMPGSVA